MMVRLAMALVGSSLTRTSPFLTCMPSWAWIAITCPPRRYCIDRQLTDPGPGKPRRDQPADQITERGAQARRRRFDDLDRRRQEFPIAGVAVGARQRRPGDIDDGRTPSARPRSAAAPAKRGTAG